MGLDDALRGARHQADWLAKQERAKQERKTLLEGKIEQLLHEALHHLRPYGSDMFAQAKRVSVGTAHYKGRDGARYRALSRQRCWIISAMEGMSGPDRKGPWMKSPILLLECGVGGRFWLNPELVGVAGLTEHISTYGYDELTKPGLFISSNPDPVEDLERHLAHAIVKYEREG
ncbi:hypothetical protein [Streptomyces sp. NPDC017964]|uniref:hypothetical protein n=1 Tax=Streptomyces sp. NPDC017964 TaxID=3365022 RepID=UPI00379F3569